MTELNNMIVKTIYFLTIFYCIASCSFLTKKIESLSTPINEVSVNTKVIKKNIFCPENNKIQLILEDDSTVKFYQPLIPIIFENKTFSFIQKASMLSLIEMSRRPDVSSPSARLQYYLRYNNKDYYFDFRPKNLEDDTKMPYLKGIEVLLKMFDKSNSLLKVSAKLNQYLPQNINVTPELENFLKHYKKDITKNENLFNVFFKGDEVLTKHESFKRNNLIQIIKSFNNENISNDSFYESSKNSIFKADSGRNDLDLRCNFDFNKDNSLKEEFIFTDQRKSHYFSIKEGDNFFIAISSTIFKKPFKTFDSTYFIKSLASPLPEPICQFKNSVQDLVLISSNGRNPAQHLKHLVTYDINLVDSFLGLKEILQFSRHLFLTNPDRILYESKKGRKSQLDLFLNMNFPIYHVEAIGDIVGLGVFKNGKYEDKSLIIDDRSNARLWCSP